MPMDDYLKEALELARAQASVRVMTETEITAFVQKVASSLQAIAAGNAPVAECGVNTVNAEDAKKSIREKSVKCLVCGKTFKVLTKRHLATHDMTPEEYREQFGLKKGTSLIAKGLQRARRAKMKDMRLWERRKKHA